MVGLLKLAVETSHSPVDHEIPPKLEGSRVLHNPQPLLLSLKELN